LRPADDGQQVAVAEVVLVDVDPTVRAEVGPDARSGDDAELQTVGNGRVLGVLNTSHGLLVLENGPLATT